MGIVSVVCVGRSPGRFRAWLLQLLTPSRRSRFFHRRSLPPLTHLPGLGGDLNLTPPIQHPPVQRLIPHHLLNTLQHGLSILQLLKVLVAPSEVGSFSPPRAQADV